MDDSAAGVLSRHHHHHHSLDLVSPDNTTVGRYYCTVLYCTVLYCTVQVGRYYCVASNSLGRATKSILVTGRATNIRMVSQRFGQLDSEYPLQWEADTQVRRRLQ